MEQLTKNKGFGRHGALTRKIKSAIKIKIPKGSEIDSKAIAWLCLCVRVCLKPNL